MQDSDERIAVAGMRDGNLLLAAFGAILLFGGLLLTPEHLVALGPMRTSLESHNAFVREIAGLEVVALRIGFALAGIGLIMLGFFAGHLRQVSWLGPAFDYPVRTQDAAWSGRSGAVVGAGILVCLGLIVAGPYLPARFGELLTMEDGLVEYATAGLFLVASGLSFSVANRGTDRRRRLAHLLMAVFFFFCLGEEISWGQRILGFATPEALSRINAQDEFNLHNSVGYLVDHLFIAGVFIYGAVLPLMASRFPPVNYVAAATRLPVASLGLAAGFATISLMHDWTVYLVVADNGWRVAEFRELLSALGFVLLILESRSSVPGD